MYQALVALDNYIWLPLIPKGIFPFQYLMKRNFTLAEKSQRNEAADCDLFSRVLSDLFFNPQFRQWTALKRGIQNDMEADLQHREQI